MKYVGMLSMIARERANSVRAQELLLVEHLRQYSPEFRLTQNRRHRPAGTAYLSWVVDVLCQLRARRKESLKALAHLRILCFQFPLKNGDCTQGKQSYQGAHFQSLRCPVRQTQHVIKESVFLVPHPRIFAGMHHRRGNPQEMLRELGGHFRISRSFPRQLHCDI